MITHVEDDEHILLFLGMATFASLSQDSTHRVQLIESGLIAVVCLSWQQQSNNTVLKFAADVCSNLAQHGECARSLVEGGLAPLIARHLNEASNDELLLGACQVFELLARVKPVCVTLVDQKVDISLPHSCHFVRNSTVHTVYYY